MGFAATKKFEQRLTQLIQKNSIKNEIKGENKTC
jgi:hypothetical protein